MKKSFFVVAAAVIVSIFTSCSALKPVTSISVKLPSDLSDSLTLLRNISADEVDVVASFYTLSFEMSGDYSMVETRTFKELFQINGQVFSVDDLSADMNITILASIGYNGKTYYEGSKSLTLAEGANNVNLELAPSFAIEDLVILAGYEGDEPFAGESGKVFPFMDKHIVFSVNLSKPLSPESSVKWTVNDEIIESQKKGNEILAFFNPVSGSVKLYRNENNTVVCTVTDGPFVKTAAFILCFEKEEFDTFELSYNYPEGQDYILMNEFSFDDVIITEKYKNGFDVTPAPHEGYFANEPDPFGIGFVPCTIVRNEPYIEKTIWVKVKFELPETKVINPRISVGNDFVEEIQCLCGDDDKNFILWTTSFNNGTIYPVEGSLESSSIPDIVSTSTQWRVNGENISGENSGTYYFTPVSEGTFVVDCLVTLIPEKELTDFCVQKNNEPYATNSITVKVIPTEEAVTQVSSLPEPQIEYTTEESDCNFIVSNRHDYPEGIEYSWTLNGNQLDCDSCVLKLNLNLSPFAVEGINRIEVTVKYRDIFSSGSTIVELK